MTYRSDRELVRECIEGNIQAFEPLVDRYQKPIFNVALRMVHGPDDAQEVTQIVFVKAYEKLDNFNPKFKFFSWIYRMAVNESINFLKRQKKHQGLDEEMYSNEKTPEQQFHAVEMTDKLMNALMELQIDYRAVVVLKHLEGLSYSEVSYILEIPEKTVKSRLFTARQRLKEILSAKGITIHAQ